MKKLLLFVLFTCHTCTPFVISLAPANKSIKQVEWFALYGDSFDSYSTISDQTIESGRPLFFKGDYISTNSTQFQEHAKVSPGNRLTGIVIVVKGVWYGIDLRAFAIDQLKSTKFTITIFDGPQIEISELNKVKNRIPVDGLLSKSQLEALAREKRMLAISKEPETKAQGAQESNLLLHLSECRSQASGLQREVISLIEKEQKLNERLATLQEAVNKISAHFAPETPAE